MNLVAMNKCNTVGSMADQFRTDYNTEIKLGQLTKQMIVIGLKKAMQVNTDIENKLRECEHLSDMVELLANNYGNARIEEQNKEKIIKGFQTIVTMTRCRKW